MVEANLLTFASSLRLALEQQVFCVRDFSYHNHKLCKSRAEMHLCKPKYKWNVHLYQECEQLSRNRSSYSSSFLKATACCNTTQTWLPSFGKQHSVQHSTEANNIHSGENTLLPCSSCRSEKSHKHLQNFCHTHTYDRPTHYIQYTYLHFSRISFLQ